MSGQSHHLDFGQLGIAEFKTSERRLADDELCVADYGGADLSFRHTLLDHLFASLNRHHSL